MLLRESVRGKDGKIKGKEMGININNVFVLTTKSQILLIMPHYSILYGAKDGQENLIKGTKLKLRP